MEKIMIVMIFTQRKTITKHATKVTAIFRALFIDHVAPSLRSQTVSIF